MNDRQPTKPGRALITPEDGTPAFYATITRADEPTDPGTPYNKATQLTDETAAAIGGLPSNPTVNDAFAGINEHTKISSGTSALLGGADTADKALRYINDLVKISPETSALLGGAQKVNEAMQQLAALTAAAQSAANGKCRIETGVYMAMYTGSGSNLTISATIYFSEMPKIGFFCSEYYIAIMNFQNKMIVGRTGGGAYAYGPITVSASGNSVTWSKKGSTLSVGEPIGLWPIDIDRPYIFII